MRVLVIPEDYRKDQYVLDPIIRAMMSALGKPRAKVEICRDPLLGGVVEALKWDRIVEILDQNQGMVQLFLLCVDRDGLPGRRDALDSLEKKANSFLTGQRAEFLAVNAWQELEVWVLAGHDLPTDWNWKEIRAEANPKERFFQPLAAGRKLLDEPGEGRRTLAREAARRYDRIQKLCPEDVANLQARINDVMKIA
jgi:hypothetical protein